MKTYLKLKPEEISIHMDGTEQMSSHLLRDGTISLCFSSFYGDTTLFLESSQPVDVIREVSWNIISSLPHDKRERLEEMGEAFIGELIDEMAIMESEDIKANTEEVIA